MSKKVTQEYFDSIVKENIEEFSMSLDEAISDAVEQLKTQNIDLANIVKCGPDEIELLLNSIRKLEGYLNAEPNADQVKEACQLIKEKFHKDLSFRVLATKKLKANDVFIKFLDKYQLSSSFICEFMQMYTLYLTNQTDVLDLNAIKTLIGITKSTESLDMLKCLLKCLVTSCVLCESNRQMYVENGLCELLLDLFKKYRTSNLILVEICNLIRNLLLDDDLRVEFGKSHETAKFIASQLNGLDVLLNIALSNEELNEETLGSIMLTLSRLAVRNEYCQEIYDKGGLKFIIKCMAEEHLQNQSLLKSSLSLLKSICNNDKVKDEATKMNAVYLIVQILSKYSPNPTICELTCAALATILLRNLDACEKLVSYDGDLILMQVLSMHLTKPKVAKVCCLSIRNLVSRNKSLGDKLLNANVEDPLRKVLNQNDPACHEEAKAALRDLNLNVDLKELWTGSGRQLEYD